MALLLVLLSASGCGNTTSSKELLRIARLKVAAGDLSSALKLAQQVHRTDPLWRDAQFVAGDVLMRQKQFPQAIALWQTLFGQAPASFEKDPYFFAGQCCREIGRLSEGEQYLRTALEHFPDNVAAREQLAFILSGSGQIWEAGRHFDVLIRSEAATYERLVLLGDLERPVEQQALFEEYEKNVPGDPIVALGLAANAFQEGKATEAVDRLSAVIRTSPQFADAQAMMGELLVDADVTEFRRWHQALPSAALENPGIWYVFGVYARRHDRLDLAISCFQRAIRIAPTHRRAFYQLSQVLHAIQSPSAASVTDYAESLLNLSSALDNVLRSDGNNAERTRTVVSLLESAGRIWEACSWSMIALQKFPQEAWPKEVLLKYRDILHDDLPLVVLTATPIPEFSPEVDIDFGAFLAGVNQKRGLPSSQSGDDNIRFDDREIAIDFAYQNGHDADTPGVRMFEQTGGGVAVTDFDLDGCPDIFFSQGGHYDEIRKTFFHGPAEMDALFRNRRSDFENVSSISLPPDIGFGQGTSVGDFNNDGFPDLYVGNVGQNQLLENMGDGTFRDVSDQPGALSPTFWTASTAIADLNADGDPELIDVNYLVGDGIYSAICRGKACSPSVFEAAPDHVRLNRGDGMFTTVDSITGSKGLGCVVFRSDSTAETNVFISNDQVANVFLAYRPGTESDRLPHSENGLQNGLAFDEDGLSMGCMGIAADDVSGNGLIDLFVTNFHNEANTLYLQDAPGLFVDRTKTTGLYLSGYPFVGWGTQFLDADLDGLSDIVVANGHVDDYRDEGGEYHMRPLFYRHEGGTSFREVSGPGIGEFFSQKFLGRGLARLDWNNDGVMDFAVSNIRQPPSVVTNRSSKVGHFLNLRLHATKSARDAIGTNVTVSTSHSSWTKQLTAGDGYMASNQRILQFGLGVEPLINEVKIRWPSGSITLLQNISVDKTVTVVEHRGHFECP